MIEAILGGAPGSLADAVARVETDARNGVPAASHLLATLAGAGIGFGGWILRGRDTAVDGCRPSASTMSAVAKYHPRPYPCQRDHSSKSRDHNKQSFLDCPSVRYLVKDQHHFVPSLALGPSSELNTEAHYR